MGARIIRDHLKKYNSGFIELVFVVKNWVSSLPKWYDATIKKISKDIAGNKTQAIIIKIASNMYET